VSEKLMNIIFVLAGYYAFAHLVINK